MSKAYLIAMTMAAVGVVASALLGAHTRESRAYVRGYAAARDSVIRSMTTLEFPRPDTVMYTKTVTLVRDQHGHWNVTEELYR